MIDENDVPDIEGVEQLDRCVVFSKHLRAAKLEASNLGRVKPGAFIPHPYDDLSVNRQLRSTNGEVWELCRQVALQLRKTLYGRATVLATDFLSKKLTVNPDPIRSDNPDGLPPNANHAIVVGWPQEKSAQIAIAQDIADGCRFYAPPADGIVSSEHTK